MNAAYSTTYRKGGKTYTLRQKNLDADTAWYVSDKLLGAIRIKQPDGTWWVYAPEGAHTNPQRQGKHRRQVKHRRNHWVLPVAVGAAVGAIAERKYKLATKGMKAASKVKHAGKRKNPSRHNGGGYEVIPSVFWKNVRTGATASVYGAVPWTRQGEKDDWQRVTAGWTVRTPEGTVGIGRVPWATREEAEAWVRKERARLAEAEKGRLAWLAEHPPEEEKARRRVRSTRKVAGARKNPAKCGHRRNHWLLPLAVGIPAGAMLEKKYKLTRKVVKNPAKKHRRNGEYGPDYTVAGKSGNYGVYLGGDLYSGRRIISGFKTRKDAEKAKSALVDARYDHSQGKHNNYFVTSRYGYSAVDYDAGKGERTAITGISRGMAQSMLFALQDANAGRHGERFGR